MKNFILVTIYVILSSLGLVFFKLGVKKEFFFNYNSGNINLGVNIFSVVGLSFYVFSFLMYLFIASKFNLTYIAPISMGLISISTLVFSVLILKETIGLFNIISFVLILSGILIANIKQ